MAGCVGVVPWSFTYGELSLMAEGRDAAKWWHTASLVSPVRCALGDRKSVAECHPYEAERLRRKAQRPELQQAAAEANRAAWRAFCDTYKK